MCCASCGLEGSAGLCEDDRCDDRSEDDCCDDRSEDDRRGSADVGNRSLDDVSRMGCAGSG